MNIAGYLYREIDENICLYNWYRISNSLMDHEVLDEFNLQPTCAKEPENNSTRVICSNTLRFPDLANSKKIYDGGVINGTGIEEQVTCKLFF